MSANQMGAADPLPSDERRRRYFQDYGDRVDRHRETFTIYEHRAIEFASSAMRGLTYLNGGGLLAIPAVVALFKANPSEVKTPLIYAAAAFIAGLVFVILSQAFTFFVMARRSEAAMLYAFEEMELLAQVHYPTTAEDHKSRSDRAQNHRDIAVVKIRRSDVWRALALISIWLSLLLFIGGCYLGGAAVLGAKYKLLRRSRLLATLGIAAPAYITPSEGRLAH